MILKAPVLCHFDANKPVKLACDASAYGLQLGAVLSHQTAEGVEKPIAFASRKITDTEKNSAQVEREALALIFWCQEVSPVSVGKEIYTRNGPQTVSHHIRSQNWNANISRSTTADMGSDAVGAHI